MNTTTLAAKDLTKIDLIKKAQKEVGQMIPKELKKLLDKGEDIIVLDVRENKQRAEGKIPSDEINEESFISITRGNLEWKANEVLDDKETIIVTYCRKGGRGALAAQVLRKMGYINATTLKGGLKGWAESGYAIQTGLGLSVLNKLK
jgi:rhodanese-related sulfurtransferase